MELADPHGSYAVLVGSTRYDSTDLEDLPAVAENLRDLGRLLEDPGVWGLPPERCIRVVDPDSPQVFLDAVREAAQRATDTLLFYFAGHGLTPLDEDGLLLALPSTDPDRAYSAVDYARVRREVLGTGPRVNRVVILDCCYSGKAFEGAMSGPVSDSVSDSVTMAEQARIAGTYLLTACAANTRALAAPGETHTAFTGELIRLLDQGLPGAGPLIGATDVYDHLVGELRAKGRPTPQQRLGNTGRTLSFARNRHGRPGRRDPSGAGPGLAGPGFPGPGSAAWGSVAQGAAGSAASVPVVPEGLHEVLRRPPRAIAERAAYLHTTDRATGRELLRLAALTRPAQEAAALACVLREEGSADAADTVLATVAEERSPLDLAAIVPTLRALDDDEAVARLLPAIAERRGPEDVASTIRILHEDSAGHGSRPDADALLTAAMATLDTTEAVLGLAGALWSAQLDDHATLVLRAPSVSSPEETSRLADALHSIGRTAEALALHRQIYKFIARDPAEVVRLVRILEQVGEASEAHGLLHQAMRATTTLAQIMVLCEALWTAGMGEHAQDALAGYARVLSARGVIAFAALLQGQGHDDAVLHLLGHAARSQPVSHTPDIVEALRSMGRPLDARSLLTDAAKRRTPEEIGELLALLAARDHAHVRDALPPEPLRIAQVIHHGHASGTPVQELIEGLRRLPEPEFAEVLVTLPKHGLGDVVDLLIRHVVQTAPEKAQRYLRHVADFGTALDRTVLQAKLRSAGAPVGPVRAETIAALLGREGPDPSLDERVAVITALCEAGLTEPVADLLATSARLMPIPQVVALLSALDAAGLTAVARAIVDGAGWMFPDLYREFVGALADAGLRALATYALQSAPPRLTAAQRQELSEVLGLPAPALPAPALPDNRPDEPPPPPRPRLDRWRRR
ncbi:caspase family protein [Streptomyces sp. P9(2023)]|uniref:caspase, EACC1-associated type n=1 Tax=Streptomyces sp. P9(2023) TaxID=3064394 RepID=UPI0028F406BE|nr:caspase family protein [Streptomyces sp. P9(2023)]MDT9686954.1 caspase family protein [Streptomyces sp. P9(2023)]